jgi:N-methylhydantoinase B
VTAGRPARLDPVTLQVLTGSFRALCEEMGAVLVRAAHSANIKERRDASTALFDAAGEMVMQAEHIPVHLGAMPDAVAAVRSLEQRRGDAWILNDPYRGGTHLPDITVVSPLFQGETLVAFAASRAHHADVGGATPGSMPARSSTLEEEGVVIGPTRIAVDGRVEEELLRELTSRMRGARQREADLRAQLAANRVADIRLEQLVERNGLELVRRGMAEVLDYAERRTRASIERIPDGSYRARDLLEAEAGGELAIEVTVVVRGQEVEVDFAGTDPQSAGNLNCPLSVTKSAVYYVLRVATDPDIPASAGAYRPIAVTAPLGCLVNARRPAAVAGGNVETSSRIADVVMLALGEALPLPAQGQGTMNNLTLGNDAFTYYETLGGGQGACPDADGPSGVHVAMSNTLNTPVEALEQEFPLRVRELSLRRGSGGAGAFGGGDGLIREIEAREPMQYSLLTERRRFAPRGAAGGRPGAPGRNLLRPIEGALEELPAKAEGRLEAGDALRIETPGGGGYGPGRVDASSNGPAGTGAGDDVQR